MQLHSPRFDDARVVVVGDLMLDRYWIGDTGRVSPEAPVPVINVNAVEDRPGGAANVALNLAALGARVVLLGAVGDDAEGIILRERLTAAGVECDLVTVPNWPTITKLRAISRHQQLLRMDFEQPLPAPLAAELEQRLARHLPGTGAVVLSDYAKGALETPQGLIRLARQAGAKVVVDPKVRNFHDWSGADVVKPNFAEFKDAAGHAITDDHSLVAAAEQLLADNGIEALLVTRGEEGMSLVRRGQQPLHIPARAVDVYDVTGAGDTVAAVLAAALAQGKDLAEAAALANVAAGLVVSRSGTVAVTGPELRLAIQRDGASDRGVLTQEQLLLAAEDARRRGERLVFTNGCFDIIHAGHVGYLEEARALGDRLIVAINDDASVRRLKGPGRPVNAVQYRARVLAGLAAVDWVVAFAEDTPENLLAALLPNVLVKGGDYAIDEVVGADIIRAAGGEVAVLSMVDDLSTTSIVRKLSAAQPDAD